MYKAAINLSKSPSRVSLGHVVGPSPSPQSNAPQRLKVKQPAQRADPVPTSQAEPTAVAPHAPSVLQAEREAFQRVLAHMTHAAEQMKTQQEQWQLQTQSTVIKLAVSIASRLIHEKIKSGEFAVETLVRKMVERMGTPDNAVVCLHPEDIALLQRRLAGQPLFDDAAQVRLIADPALPRGDCRVEVGEACLLSHIDRQLDELEALLHQAAEQCGANG